MDKTLRIVLSIFGAISFLLLTLFMLGTGGGLNVGSGPSANSGPPERAGGGAAAARDEVPDLSPLLKRKSSRLSPRSPFYDLSDEERSKVWWEIAEAGKRVRGDEITYSLDTEQANAIARKYHCTPNEIVEFFRAGRDSDWLRLEDGEDEK